ncbi:MAG: mannose-1-phosphate guanylyltransferase, partial [Candidatus Latescibacteria bacterium]|nr:mannose-1-phosphate guanylyltransferase [Candidatus Latescibacterota bacterium]
ALAPEVPASHVIGEPVGKNTAPAIALASLWIEAAGKDAVVAVLPSDHRVEPADRFREELTRAAEAALRRRAIVTFGVPPTRPETGYGYIESGDPVEPGSPFHSVKAFREKPDSANAARYAADGRHLWNAGMFVFPPAVMLEEIRSLKPEFAGLLDRAAEGASGGAGGRGAPGAAGAAGDAEAPGAGGGSDAVLERYYADAPSISIDYAVMERSSRSLVARAGFAWDDLGSWAALALPQARDRSGNVIRGEAILEDCENVVAFSDGGLLAALGVQDLVIVRTKDATLVCRRDRAQEVRAIVEKLKKGKGLDAYL